MKSSRLKVTHQTLLSIYYVITSIWKLNNLLLLYCFSSCLNWCQSTVNSLFSFFGISCEQTPSFPPLCTAAWNNGVRQHRTQQSNNEPDGCQVSSILAILSVWAENKTFAVMLDHSRTVRTQMLEKRCRFHKMLPVCQWKLLVSGGGFLNPRDDVERAQLSGIEP